MQLGDNNDAQAPRLGECTFDTPLTGGHGVRFVEESEGIPVDDSISALTAGNVPIFELAGPRHKLYFDPKRTTMGVVTCGGLCPGLNDVIRGITLAGHHLYKVRAILGFRYGYAGCAAEDGHIMLTPEYVERIHWQGGSVLGSSRGEQSSEEIVDRLVQLGVDILFVIGGDGTMRGAMDIADEIQNRKAKLAVVAIPKTIDNDIQYIDQSFGFDTAFSVAARALDSAHNEARSAINGIGVVKLMGRHSGFIACAAALASGDVNFVLIPEAPFKLDGPGGLLEVLKARLEARKHALIAVAEGAGQDLLECDPTITDASGNVKLMDIGTYLCDRIKAHFKSIDMEVNLKYIDPSYLVRSISSSPTDSYYCIRLAHAAVHAAMAGRTRIMVAKYHNRRVHVPIRMAVAERNVVDPKGDLWQSVLDATGQPSLVG